MPNFINLSVLPGAASFFTQEFALLLARYPGLMVEQSNQFNQEAVMIGVIHSQDTLKKTLKNDINSS